VFQNGANARINKKQGEVSMHHFETPIPVHYVGHSKKDMPMSPMNPSLPFDITIDQPHLS
jgi:hypothetical protein